MRNILSLLVLLALSVDELSAQTTSSGSQTVTFGVQRMTMQVPAWTATMNVASQSPLKVTVGSQWKLQGVAEPVVRASQQNYASEKLSAIARFSSLQTASPLRESKISGSRSPIAKSASPADLLVTLTE